MWQKLKKNWTELKRSRPGERFQQRFVRHQKSPIASTWWCRPLLWGGGIVLLAIGAFFSVVPGPGIPFLILGGALIASESRVASRALDWLELKIRAVAGHARRWWRRLPGAAKALAVMGAIAISAAGAYAGYWFFIGRS